MAAGVGAAGVGDRDDHQDRGETPDQVWTILARARGYVGTVNYFKIGIFDFLRKLFELCFFDGSELFVLI